MHIRTIRYDRAGEGYRACSRVSSSCVDKSSASASASAACPHGGTLVWNSGQDKTG